MGSSASGEAPDDRAIENAMGSPLRLQLVADLLAAEDGSLTLQQAVRRVGRHEGDVLPCLRPMVRWGVLEERDGGQRFRIRDDAPERVMAVLRRVVADRGEHLERERAVRHQTLCGLIGVDPKMLVVFEMIHRIARLDVPVLITGETGTGKELVARAIHELSHRQRAEFGAVNCPTLTDELFASEMFGHVRGAFTGATRDHAGLVERCDGGTLFLDEIADLSPGNQVKLLRVVQERTYTRVGDEQVRRSDFRIICATNRDLAGMVADGEFREDLYYRLNVFPLRVPSLRERPDDLPFLAEELLAGKLRQLRPDGTPAALTRGALDALARHGWPGNVRELENVLTRALIVAGDGPIEAAHLPPLDAGPAPGAPPPPPGSRLCSLADAERDHVAFVLRHHEGNISAAAATLGVSRTTLYKKIRTYGLDPVSV